MSMKTNKRGTLKILIIVVLSILIVLALVVFLCPLPFHKEFKCIRIRLDEPSYEEEVLIGFDGYYHLNLFSEDSFSGVMTTVYSNQKDSAEITGLLISKEGAYLYVHQADDGSVYISAHSAPLPLEEDSLKNKEVRFCGGRLDSERFFKRFAFLSCAEVPAGQHHGWDFWNWNETDGICIVPDCEDYESARQYLVEMGIIQMD